MHCCHFDEKNYIAVAVYLQSLQDFTFLGDPSDANHIGTANKCGKCRRGEVLARHVGQEHLGLEVVDHAGTGLGPRGRDGPEGNQEGDGEEQR